MDVDIDVTQNIKRPCLTKISANMEDERVVAADPKQPQGRC